MSSNDGAKWINTSKICSSILCLLIIITVIVLIVVYWSKIYVLINPNKSNKPNNANGSTGGSLPYTCPSSKYLYNGSCYTKCNELDNVKQDLQQNPQLKFDNSGSLCISECPQGSIDYGVSCEKLSNYTNPGRIPDVTCPTGWNVQGIGNASWCSNANNIFQTSASTKSCKPDEELNQGFCYPNCKTNYRLADWGTCVPIQNTMNGCPAGFTNVSEECYKKSYSRDLGTPLTCGPEDEMIANYCFPK